MRKSNGRAITRRRISKQKQMRIKHASYIYFDKVLKEKDHASIDMLQIRIIRTTRLLILR